MSLNAMERSKKRKLHLDLSCLYQQSLHRLYLEHDVCIILNVAFLFVLQSLLKFLSLCLYDSILLLGNLVYLDVGVI